MIHNHSQSLAVYRDPFTLSYPHVEVWDDDATVWRVVERICRTRDLPADFPTRGVVCINGEEVPRRMWKYVRPRPHAGAGHPDIILTMHYPMQGGGGQGSGGKAVIGLVAAIALTVVTGGIAAGSLSSLTPLLGAGTLGAQVAAAAVSIGGALLIGALVAPPSRQNADTRRSDNSVGGISLDAASAQGNVLDQNASIPRVLGTRRIFPPFAMEPMVELVGQDEIVHAVYVLAGPHLLEDFRLGDGGIEVPSTQVTDIDLEYRSGLPDEPLLDLNTRQSRTLSYNVEMSVHTVDPENMGTLQSASGALPVWHAVGSRDTPDEVWIHFLMRGLVRNASPTQVLRIPFRMRARLRGTSTWRYFPEIHYAGNTQSQVRLQFKLLFEEPNFTQPPVAPTSNGFLEARKSVPAQNVNPLGSTWTADAYFSGGSGNDSYRSSTENTTNVRNVKLSNDYVEFYLDRDDWPEGIYDIELIRGACISNSDYTPSSYTYSGDVLDFFGFRDSLAMPLSREGLLDTVGIVRSVSVWNQYPFNPRNLTVISVQAKNRSVERLSVLASGYVRDWDESEETWSDWTTTSNPAPHYVDVLSGALNLNPLPSYLRDDASLVEWREICEDEDYTCDIIAEGIGTGELLRLLASCGYARPYQSETWGVIRDYDRSAETPIQIFSARNSRGFAWKKAFPRLPAGFRVNYRNILSNYDQEQLIVRRAGYDGATERYEQITYDGIVYEDKALARAIFDLRQAELRSTFYTLRAPAEWLRCRRGSLVGVEHDLLASHSGTGRIIQLTIEDNGGGDEITEIQLDTLVDLYNEDDMFDIDDMFEVVDMFLVGIQSGVTIRQTDGVLLTVPLANTTGRTDTLIPATPIPVQTWGGGPFDQADIGEVDEGCLVVIGPITQESKRLVVYDIVPETDLTATLTLVDEAPGIWAPFE